MERPAHEAVSKERTRDTSADQKAPRDDARKRPRGEWREPVSERAPEEAGYGYGV